jgi:hypothetical protein
VSFIFARRASDWFPAQNWLLMSVPKGQSIAAHILANATIMAGVCLTVISIIELTTLSEKISMVVCAFLLVYGFGNL